MQDFAHGVTAAWNANRRNSVMMKPAYYSATLTPAQKKALLAIAADGRAKVHGRTLDALLHSWGGIEWHNDTVGYVLNRWGRGAVREIRREMKGTAR